MLLQGDDACKPWRHPSTAKETLPFQAHLFPGQTTKIQLSSFLPIYGAEERGRRGLTPRKIKDDLKERRMRYHLSLGPTRLTTLNWRSFLLKRAGARMRLYPAFFSLLMVV